MDRLKPNDRLLPDQELTSSNGLYRVVLQKDGNLVIYGLRGVIWSSQTAGRHPEALIMQGDGNCVLYEEGGAFMWASGTDHNALAEARLLDDGAFVVSHRNVELWSSGADRANDIASLIY